MAKLTILYGHPTDPEAFEDYYENTHLPFSQKMGGVESFELTRVKPSPGATEGSWYRIAEMWWSDEASLREAIESDAGREVIADLDNFATGGVSLVVSD